MTVRHLIELADVKEAQALAMLTYYMPKIENNEIQIEEVQEKIDVYCKNMADSFINNYQEELKDSLINQQLRNYILSIKADKPHSGYRFYETLYKKINELDCNNEKEV